jgi:hypothetical protein
MALYEETIDDFKVPAKRRAREIVAPTRSRANQLRRWAVAGRLPELLEGRALLVPGPEDAGEIAATFAENENIDSLVGRYALSPTLVSGADPFAVGAARVVDLGRPTDLTGPYAGDTLGFGFKLLSREDALYRPAVEHATDAASLVALTGIELPTDSNGDPVLDSARLGPYVSLESKLPSSFFKGLFDLEPGTVAEPLELPDGTLLVRVTGRDSAHDTPFAEIAKAFSTGGSRWNGGDMHWLTRDDKARDEKVLKAVFSLGEGRVSQIIKLSDTSYTFVKVEDREDAYTRPFDEVKSKLETSLRREKEQELTVLTMNELEDGADIEILMQESDFVFETDEPEEVGGEEGTSPDTPSEPEQP